MIIFNNVFIGMAISIIIFEFFYYSFIGRKKGEIPPLKYIYFFGFFGGFFSIIPTLLEVFLNIKLANFLCNLFFFNCYIQQLDPVLLSFMSKLLNNVIGGMSISLMFFEIIYLYNKKIRGTPKIIYFYFFSFFGVILSLIPTFIRLIFNIELPYIICNLFFFNCLIRRLDPTGSEVFSFIFFFLFFITTIIVSLLVRKEKSRSILPTID